MVVWKRKTSEAGHGPMQSVESHRRNRPNAWRYCWNEAGEMVARRRVLNEARAVTRSGYVVSRKDEMAVERTGVEGWRGESEDGRSGLELLG